jgi:hypothetical protein
LTVTVEGWAPISKVLPPMTTSLGLDGGKVAEDPELLDPERLEELLVGDLEQPGGVVKGATVCPGGTCTREPDWHLLNWSVLSKNTWVRFTGLTSIREANSRLRRKVKSLRHWKRDKACCLSNSWLNSSASCVLGKPSGRAGVSRVCTAKITIIAALVAWNASGDWTKVIARETRILN